MTHALEVQQAFRDLEVQAQVHAKTLETLKARVLSRFAVADHAQDAGSATEVGRLRGELTEARARADRLSASLADCERERRKAARERDDALAACDEVGKVLARTRTELADALGALEQERECRQTYQRRLSHAMREVERLKASEAASVERERKLTDALRVGGERCAAAERARKVLIDQVAALHGRNPSDGAVRAAHGMLIHSGQSAIRSALRAAFVHDHLEAGEPRT